MHDKPSLSLAEAVAVGRAMLQCAEAFANRDQQIKSVSNLTTYKDIAVPAKPGDPNPLMTNIQPDIFSSSVADLQIPSFSGPEVAPYRGGFHMSVIDNVIRHNAPTIQDMSTLVLDNARFSGELMDTQDRQWYTMPQPEHIASNEAPPPIACTTIAVSTSNEFAAFSSRSRNLGRMSSEQALDYFLDQHNTRSSQ